MSGAFKSQMVGVHVCLSRRGHQCLERGQWLYCEITARYRASCRVPLSLPHLFSPMNHQTRAIQAPSSRFGILHPRPRYLRRLPSSRPGYMLATQNTHQVPGPLPAVPPTERVPFLSLRWTEVQVAARLRSREPPPSGCEPVGLSTPVPRLILSLCLRLPRAVSMSRNNHRRGAGRLVEAFQLPSRSWLVPLLPRRRPWQLRSRRRLL